MKSQYRESNKKRSGGNTSKGQCSKWQSYRSSSGNSSIPQENIGNQGSSRSNEEPTCSNCQKKHWGECCIGSTTCYRCVQEGHQIKDCPKRNRAQRAGTSASASAQQPLAIRRNNLPRQGRVFCICARKYHSYYLRSVRYTPHLWSTYTCPYGFWFYPFFCFISFEHYLHTSPVPLEYELVVLLPSENSISCDRVYNSCEIHINNVRPVFQNFII